MGIGKALGSISPLAGAVTGRGMFGKGLAKLADSGAGMLVPMSYLAQSQRDKKARAAEEEEALRARRGPRAGVMMMRARTDAGSPTGMKKGGKVKKMAKGGSTASKRADGCAVKGKTKGRFV
jgi:hypothetical protein